MKRILKLSVLCVCIVVVSCKSTDTAKTHIINFPEAIDNIGLINLSEVAKSIRYVPLETRGDALVGESPRISYDGKHIVVADYQSGIIKVFDNNGKFIRSINRVGRGSEEFLPMITILSIFNENIVVMTEREIVEYDIYGNFVRKVAVPNVEGYRVGNPIMIGENRYAASLVDFTSGNKEYCAVVYDSLSNIDQLITVSGISGPKAMSGGGIGGAQTFGVIPVARLFQYGDTFRLYYPESEEILSVDKSNVMDTVYVIEYGEYKIESNLSPDSRYIQLTSFLESENFLFMSAYTFATITTTGSHRMNFLYDKEAKKTSVLYDKAESKYGFKDDIGNGPEFWPRSTFGGKMVLSDISALSLIEFAENNTVSKELEKIVSAIDENSNPVIAIVELK
jgi:hypothetical protein